LQPSCDGMARWSGGVCRRVLCNYHDAEDAFQATFLVLVRKAVSIMPREMVGNWLYGVARQTALKARVTAARRKGRERQVARMPEPAVGEQGFWRDLQPLLDEELSRLPDKYRVVIVFCDLEGKTRKETARLLGCPEGTVAGRLARARTMLSKRLGRQGIAVSGGALAVLLTEKEASAGVPTSVMSSTIKAVTLVAAGQAAAARLVSAKVAALTEGVLKSMLLPKLKVVVMLFVVATLCSATGLTYRTRTSEQPKAQQADKDKQPAAAKMDAKPEPDRERLQGTWKIICKKDSAFGNCIDGKWTIKGATIREEARMKEEANGNGEPDSPGIRKLKMHYRFCLDEKTNPKRIVLIAGEADDLFDLAKWDQKLDHPDVTEGIYRLAGNTLKICLRASKWNKPPTKFDWGDGILILLQREIPKKGALVHPPTHQPPTVISKP
jgi:RNA polymerase sigma factor (sigma-70 family)